MEKKNQAAIDYFYFIHSWNQVENIFLKNLELLYASRASIDAFQENSRREHKNRAKINEFSADGETGRKIAFLAQRELHVLREREERERERDTETERQRGRERESGGDM